MLETIFREYDIRGKVGVEFVLENIYTLGQAIAYYYLIRTGSTCTLVVARDGRVDSEYIHQELIKALRDSGISVIDLGLCPTPVMYFALQVSSAQGGLIVTASHNGKEYNGVKLCLGKESLWGKQIKEIKELFYQKKAYKAVQKGSYRSLPLAERYVLWLSSQFKELKNFRVPFVLDCAYGAAGPIMQELKRELALDTLELMYDTVDGLFPAHDPDPVTEENMRNLKERVLVTKAHFGIGLDGDGDRMSALLSSGKLLVGDRVGTLFAQDILEKYKGARVIFDVKCSGLVQEVVTSCGGMLYRSPSGHSIIKHAMKQHNALFAGEYSCHFFFKDRYFGYDDGIYAALRLCELLYRTGKSLDELVAQLPKYISSPEIRIACATEVQQKLLEGTYTFFAQKQDATLSTLDGVQASLPYGWGLVRLSHTQPEVCFRFESHTHEGLQRIKKDFYQALKNHMENTMLEASLDI